ncbi:5'-AMP-activated protein kinase beta subunit, interation domain-containing protein [Phycomyces blakesleeanus]
MGNSASTEQTQTASNGFKRQSMSNPIDHTSSDAYTEDSSTAEIVGSHKSAESLPFQMSITEPLDDSFANRPTSPQPIISDNEAPSSFPSSPPHTRHPQPEMPKAVPVATGKAGWVSSTGNTSPWVGSLSSSASSNRRDSIHGPYYRARGMSINRDSEADEDSPAPQQPILPKMIGQHKSNEPDSQGVTTLLTWTQGGNNVYVTGTFNGWKHKIKLVKSTHDFNVVLELPPGTHRLKFIVDDEWKCSNDLETATDPKGNLVNYIRVMDEDEDSTDEFNSPSKGLDRSGASTPEEEYTSKVPSDLLALATAMASAEDDKNRMAALEWERKQPQPPGLPPHLEKVLLNSQAVSEEDNSVLMEPNHVTLNHLYACSIKDQVMALSTTTRYRKKVISQGDM